MAKERDIIALEKTIISKMFSIKTGKTTPAESGIGKSINLMKSMDEHLYNELMAKYKKLLEETKNGKA